MKRTVPMIIAATTGFVLIMSHFIPLSEEWGSKAMQWFNVLAAIAFVLGGSNLMRMNLQKISDRRPGWGYAAVTLIAFLVTLSVGLLKVGVQPTSSFPTNAWAAPYNQEGSSLWWLYEYLYKPLASTMFALLAFFIASAAFRAFRAKNPEAIALLSTAFIVLMGRTYVGGLMRDILPRGMEWLSFDSMTNYIMGVFNLAGMRAITIGIALGVASTSLKVLLGVDRSYLGSGDD
ncbi:MAG: hypothetical protein KDA93_07875 [Planctomycetaceae bacterium]|nr:hypothetical protein [Planctomycetaceae bacterium]